MEQENFDFYQEALKAFDAPVPQPKRKSLNRKLRRKCPNPPPLKSPSGSAIPGGLWPFAPFYVWPW